MKENIDINEEELKRYGNQVLNFLLEDKTRTLYARSLGHHGTQNIVWATEDYITKGPEYAPNREIKAEAIVGVNAWVIQPRVSKINSKKISRTRDKGEVFTPSWICNIQNNLVDEEWFGRKDVFNFGEGISWSVNLDRIEFPDSYSRSWKKYVDAKRLEVACGEAPYLTSRYDTVTGEYIPITKRIGLLDRKLRVVSENAENFTDWITWATRAVQSIYGFDYQGDNVLLARENVLFTFIDYLRHQFPGEPSRPILEPVAKIISWNIWQMDADTFSPPYLKQPDLNPTSLEWNGEGQQKNGRQVKQQSEPVYCKVFDWRQKASVHFADLVMNK